MKKLICTLAVISLILTGCGNKVTFIDDKEEDAGYSINVTEPTQTKKPKRQEVTVTEPCTTSESPASESTSSAVNITSDTTTSTDSDGTITENINVNVENGTNSTATTVSAIAITTEPEMYYLDGIVYEVHDTYILINETDFGMVRVTVSDDSMIADTSIGDVVEITYNGLMNDGYVSYAYNAYSIETVRKAEKKYELSRFEFNGMAYSLLLPEDWSSKVIDYPQEGDFTDWGVRFFPDGNSGSIDISWHSAFQITVSMTKVSKTLYNRQVTEYSLSGIWRFIAFDNGYITANNFTDNSQYEKYSDEIDFILSTLEFE